ncbi:MAG: PepSY domain-containing protein [Nitrospinota bacterium]
MIFPAVILALCLALAPAGAAFADEDHNKFKKLKEFGYILHLKLIIKKATAVHPGHIIEVELKSRKDKYIYEIEILGDTGIVWELKYDAKTGEFLGSKIDD